MSLGPPARYPTEQHGDDDEVLDSDDESVGKFLVMVKLTLLFAILLFKPWFLMDIVRLVFAIYYLLVSSVLWGISNQL